MGSLAEGVDRSAAAELARRAARSPAGAVPVLLGALPVRRRLPSRGDPARPAGLRLYPRLAALLPRSLSEARAAARCDRPRAGRGLWLRVCVVGAGPAGSVFAARMAQLGHDGPPDRAGALSAPPPRRVADARGRAAPEVGRARARRSTRASRSASAGSASTGRTGRNGARIRASRASSSIAALFDLALVERVRAFGVEVRQPARLVERRRDGRAMAAHDRGDGRGGDARSRLSRRGERARRRARPAGEPARRRSRCSPIGAPPIRPRRPGSRPGTRPGSGACRCRTASSTRWPSSIRRRSGRRRARSSSVF